MIPDFGRRKLHMKGHITYNLSCQICGLTIKKNEEASDIVTAYSFSHSLILSFFLPFAIAISHLHTVMITDLWGFLIGEDNTMITHQV